MKEIQNMMLSGPHKVAYLNWFDKRKNVMITNHENILLQYAYTIYLLFISTYKEHFNTLFCMIIFYIPKLKCDQTFKMILTNRYIIRCYISVWVM